MEKELGVPKPGELFIGVVDFFAVLVPGVIAAALIVKAMRVTPQTDMFFISGLVIVGWVLGHALYGIGSFLDPLLYDPLFRPRDVVAEEPVEQSRFPMLTRVRSWIRGYLHKNDHLYRLAKEMTDVPELQNRQAADSVVPGGIYQWARAWLNSHSPEATAHLDRIEADSKLFRSLAVLFLIGIPVLIAFPALIELPPQWKVPAHPQRALILFSVAGVLFSLWRYCDLRNKMVRRCYLHYVQLRFESRNQGHT
jgi:hypothetical protein